MVTEEMIQIIEDAEKHLSMMAGAKVKVSLSFERNELEIRGFEFRAPELSDRSERDQLLILTCKTFAVGDILYHSKTRNYTEARFAFAFLAKKHLNLTVTEIAELLQRAHTTIISALSRTEELMQLPNDPFGKKVNAIEKDFLNLINNKQNHDEN